MFKKQLMKSLWPASLTQLISQDFETRKLPRGYIGIMEKKMETTKIQQCTYLGLYSDKGKGHGNYYDIRGYILGLYSHNGKKHGTYYNITVYTWG